MKPCKNCFVFGGLIFMFNQLAVVVSFDEIRNLQDEPITIPRVPRPPNCGTSFPGTPQWNQCWDDFRMDMAWFQQNMQVYGAKVSRMIEKNTSKGTRKSDFPKTLGSSNVMTNGYTIQTEGLSISTTTQNDKLQIKLPISGLDDVKSKIDGNELELRVGGAQQNARLAIIRFPASVKFADLKVQRLDDGILISGPVNTGGQVVKFSSNFNSMSSVPTSFTMYSGMGVGATRPGEGQPKQQNSQMWFF